MKQTSVEWLEKILKGQKEQPFDDYEWEIAFNQAKEMEKENTINFARHCLDKAKDLDILTAFMNVEQYYNQTFKSE
jgi:hypothetical protein